LAKHILCSENVFSSKLEEFQSGAAARGTQLMIGASYTLKAIATDAVFSGTKRKANYLRKETTEVDSTTSMRVSKFWRSLTFDFGQTRAKFKPRLAFRITGF